MLNHKTKGYILLSLAAILFFLPYLGSVHLFDWDEINFAEAAREMLATGDFLLVRIDYQPFHEKPPLFIWMQALTMSVFGVGEFAARLPNALIGLFTLLFVYAIGSRLFNLNFGLFWAMAYLGSLLPHFYFRSGIIDPTFNLLIFSSIYFLYLHFLKKRDSNIKFSRYLLIAAALNSLSVLTKGPVGCMLVLLTLLTIWAIKRKEMKFPIFEILFFAAIAYIPSAVWYLIVGIETGKDVFSLFINYHIRLLTTGDAGHSGPVYYHIVVLLFGCFPASILALTAFRRNADDNGPQRFFKLWAAAIGGVVILVFSIVQTKILHYSSLAFFPITFFAAYSIYNITFRNEKFRNWQKTILMGLGTVISLLIMAFPLLMMNKHIFIDKVTDEFTRGLLLSEAGWNGIESVVGLLLLLSLAGSGYYFFRKNYLNGFMSMFTGVALTVFCTLTLLAPRIEIYTQGAPIAFYKSLEGEECYVEAIGYKSYAQFFYTKRPEHLSSFGAGKSRNEFVQWLLEGEIDKTAYFVAKNKGIGKYKEKYDLVELYRLNGYVFLRREKQK